MGEIALIPVEHILGLPWFIWAFVALGFVLLMAIGGFVVYWYMMGPCRAYFRAQLNNEDLTLFLEKSGRVRFRRADYVEKIFRNMNLPLSWLQRSDESFRFGKAMIKIVNDVNGICTEPELNMAIYNYVNNWNEVELNKEAYAAEHGFEYTPELILEYKDLVQLIKDGRVDDPLVTPAVFETPIWKVAHYLAEIGPGDLEGHIKFRVSEQLEKADSGEWPTWAKGFALFLAGIAIVMIASALMGG
jgi:hypothetical protein